MIGALSEPVWKQEQSRKTKVKVNVIIVPSLMYGCETWVLNEQQESVGQATEMGVLRKIVEKSRVHRARNVEISKELRHEGMLEKVRRSQWRWRDALAERGPERLVKRVYKAGERRKKRKRPTKPIEMERCLGREGSREKRGCTKQRWKENKAEAGG